MTTTERPGEDDRELAPFRLAVDQLLDAALATRFRVAQGAGSAEAPDLERMVGEIGARVERWQEQNQARPGFEVAAGERLRHVRNIVAECADILAGRPPTGREPADLD